MNISKKGIDLIVRFEGIKLKAYLCPANVWTLGIGSTYHIDGTRVKQGDSCTSDGAYTLFNHTIMTYEHAVQSLVTSIINQDQFDALVSFVYNLGKTNFAKSTLLKKINANPSDQSIRAEFLKWNKANKKVLAGLTNRRQAEASLYFGEYL